MTAIIGFANGEHVYIGGDSSFSDGSWGRYTMRERKVWHVPYHEMIIGGSGRYAVLQTLRHHFVPEDQATSATDIDYMVTVVARDLKALLALKDVPMKNDESNTRLMIGYRGTLYSIDSVFNVNVISAQIVADGAGGDIALGALRALLNCDVAIETAMMNALAIAGRFNLTVAPPYYVECL